MVYFEKIIMNAKLKIEYRPIESVTPYASNARTHTKKQTSLVAGSILEFGFVVPILIDENDTIMAGHCRLEAAKELGMTVIPAIQAKHLSKAQVKAFRLADNRLALESGWDVELLGEELKFLSSIEIDFDIDILGFSVTETDLALGATEPLPEDEFTPEIPPDENIITKRGDVWILDGHRLTCGDCHQSQDSHHSLLFGTWVS
jgi:hypothetical protein